MYASEQRGGLERLVLMEPIGIDSLVATMVEGLDHGLPADQSLSVDATKGTAEFKEGLFQVPESSLISQGDRIRVIPCCSASRIIATIVNLSI
ncbi:uncharacterized protein ARMOST_15487 [Armillaria ostoyae]|uniref:Uncharacterized protein n=1 Tax=Armillaria ostoyae TaxID=47428 RepID=A0A284RTH9_ARMOS|nr:uncharacterized protein ARMOST_15487 [Armillaria ostoyae]